MIREWAYILLVKQCGNQPISTIPGKLRQLFNKYKFYLPPNCAISQSTAPINIRPKNHFIVQQLTQRIKI